MQSTSSQTVRNKKILRFRKKTSRTQVIWPEFMPGLGAQELRRVGWLNALGMIGH